MESRCSLRIFWGSLELLKLLYNCGDHFHSQTLTKVVSGLHNERTTQFKPNIETVPLLLILPGVPESILDLIMFDIVT